MKLQTIIVKKWAAPTRKAATAIARQHTKSIPTSRQTKGTWRFRQRPPSCFVEGTYRTKCIRHGKVCLVYGDPKGSSSSRKACR